MVLATYCATLKCRPDGKAQTASLTSLRGGISAPVAPDYASFVGDEVGGHASGRSHHQPRGGSEPRLRIIIIAGRLLDGAML